MKHLLFISYHTPPAGGIPVRRALRFLRHLPAYGWRCSLLTAKRPFDPYHPSDPEGESTLQELGLSNLVRTPTRSVGERAAAWGFRQLQRVARAGQGQASSYPLGRLSVRRRVADAFFFPDPKIAWARGAQPAAEALYRRDPFDAILATAYPWSSLVLARRLGAATRTPWVADLRDSWVDNFRGHWIGERHHELEREVLCDAARVVTATEGIQTDLERRYRDALAGRIVTIRTGYDLAESPPLPDLPRDSDRLRITYTGTFNDALPPSPVDRSPYRLLRAVGKLPKTVRDGLQIDLVGRLGAGYREWITRELGDVVSFRGPVTHREALAAQQSADVLVVVVGGDPSTAGVLTGKFVEYLGARRPIWALAPEGELRKEVARIGGFCDADEEGAIAARLTSLLGMWREGKLPSSTEAPEWSAEVSTRSLGAIFDQLVASKNSAIAPTT